MAVRCPVVHRLLQRKLRTHFCEGVVDNQTWRTRLANEITILSWKYDGQSDEDSPKELEVCGLAMYCNYLVHVT
jgi:hypothetical protein